jgi:hypothetical protein
MFCCDSSTHGQSLKDVGSDLREEFFSHEQLYVAWSRVGSAKGLHTLVPTGKTKNIYKEVPC